MCKACSICYGLCSIFKKAVRTRPGNCRSRERSGGAHRAQPGPGRRGDARLHGCQRVPRIESRADVRLTIPAAVISMAVLRAFRTRRSTKTTSFRRSRRAAGTLSAVIFVLPGPDHDWMVERLSVRAVLWRLRDRRHPRRDVQRAAAARACRPSTLPYPEGVAAAEVLKVGTAAGTAGEGNRAGLLALVGGTLASAGFAVIVATRIFAGQVAAYFRIGSATTGLGFSLSLALVGAGQLIGISVGLAMLTGLFIAWGIATPVLTACIPRRVRQRTLQRGLVASGSLHWRGCDRHRGALVPGRLARPVALGVASALSGLSAPPCDARSKTNRSTERDLPIGMVVLISLCA